MSRRVSILLVTPPYHSGVVESAGVWMPLSLAYVAGAARRAGAGVDLYDAMSLGATHDDIRRRIEKTRPSIVAIGAITAMEPDAREICAAAKEVDPAIVTVLGSVHPTFCWKEILDEDATVDLVVRGEGEATFAEVVSWYAAGSPADGLARIPGLAYREDGRPVSNPSRAFVSDLDSLEPAWDLVDWSRYFYRPRPEGRLAIVSSSRGCRQRCSFCSQQKFWDRSWRGRSPGRFVEELEMLRDRFDVRVAMLSDETPTVEPTRWERILDLMIERGTGVELLLETRVDDVLRDEAILPKYRTAGVSHIYVGVESTSQATLDLYRKDVKVESSRKAIELINAHEMVSETSFVLGTPDETAASIRETLELAKWYGPDMAFFLAITPWPYSDLHDEVKDHIATRDYRKYNLVEPVVKPAAMSLEEMRTELHRATGLFFQDRFRRLGEMSAGKRRFMAAVLKLLIEESYLGEEMRRMAGHPEMPEHVKAMLSAAGIDLGVRTTA